MMKAETEWQKPKRNGDAPPKKKKITTTRRNASVPHGQRERASENLPYSIRSARRSDAGPVGGSAGHGHTRRNDKGATNAAPSL